MRVERLLFVGATAAAAVVGNTSDVHVARYTILGAGMRADDANDAVDARAPTARRALVRTRFGSQATALRA